MAPVLHSIIYYFVKQSEIRTTEREHTGEKERKERFFKTQHTKTVVVIVVVIRVSLPHYYSYYLTKKIMGDFNDMCFIWAKGPFGPFQSVFVLVWLYEKYKNYKC